MVDNEGLVDLDWLSEFLDIPERTIYAWRQRGAGPPAWSPAATRTRAMARVGMSAYCRAAARLSEDRGDAR